MARHNVASGSALEPRIGFSRAVRLGPHIAVSGTAPITRDGKGTAGKDAYEQTKRCLEIVAEAVAGLGGALSDVTRTRVMLTNIADWEDAARAHGEYFGDIRPACTFVQVAAFIDPEWLVEVEADAIIGPQ
jgi:enamine deaminase RidA (YjgF/YER057c/UK114 family)